MWNKRIMHLLTTIMERNDKLYALLSQTATCEEGEGTNVMNIINWIGEQQIKRFKADRNRNSLKKTQHNVYRGRGCQNVSTMNFSTTEVNMPFYLFANYTCI